MEDYILEMRNISKDFSGVQVLHNVTFNVKRGEIHCLVGENGAGKSTLMKILSGVYPNNEFSGEMIVNGERQRFFKIKDSENAGIAIIYQELGLVGSMTICENIFLGNEIVERGKINWDIENRKCFDLLERLHLSELPSAVIERLGTGKQQLVEIAKALCKDINILILDEPTSSLTEADSKNLLNILRQLREQGITCIYISHKLNEVLEIADTITVLRDGRAIVTKQIAEYDEQSLIGYMVGRSMDGYYPECNHKPGDVMIEIKDWTVPHKKTPGRFILDHVNLTARKGEIIGIAGLMGAGRTELAMSIFGALGEKVSEGALILDGKLQKQFKEPMEAIESGLMYLSEDRKRYGLLLNSDLVTNISLSSLDKISKRGVIDKNAEIEKVHKGIRDLSVKTSSVFQLAKKLSGGNQQKVVFVKALLTEPKVLILDEPTRGIDVGSKYEIYQLMNALVDDGLCIIMISSELPEVINMSDRIYVMCEGRISRELDAAKDEITQEKILFYAAGGR